MIEVPNLRELMEAGAHFGHKKERSYPKAKPYIYLLKDKIYVINLEKTREMLKASLEYLENLAKEGKTVLFVGTKRQAQEAVETAAKKVEMPYVNQRWLGGMLTNFETIQRSIKHLGELEEKLSGDEAGKLTKREKAKLQEEIDKLHKVFDGIKSMKRLPDALFVVDIVKEKLAVAEANKMGIPVVGIADTNANPQLVDYPIPANDDAWKTIDLVVGLAAKAIDQGKSGQKAKKEEKETAPKAEAEGTEEE